jgi:hypothetical protein
MAITLAPTAATPPPPPRRPGSPLPPAIPQPVPAPLPAPGNGTPRSDLRNRITSWMEQRLGRAAMPVAAIAGGVLGGTAGMLTLGPVGAAVGGIGGAYMGALLFMAG